MAQAGQRLMVIFRVEDVVAIDKDDAVLVSHRARSQELRRVQDQLALRGLDRYL
jgi:hypothetical protein